jgi:hypothetical protein
LVAAVPEPLRCDREGDRRFKKDLAIVAFSAKENTFQDQGGRAVFEAGNGNALAQSVPVLYPTKMRRHIDRRKVAELLSIGWPVQEVAAHVGCSRQHVCRLIRKSKFLGRQIAEAEYRIGKECDGELAALRPEIAAALKHELDARNVRVMLWLADRLGLASGGFATREYAAGTEPQPNTGRYTTVWR